MQSIHCMFWVIYAVYRLHVYGKEALLLRQRHSKPVSLPARDKVIGESYSHTTIQEVWRGLVLLQQKHGGRLLCT